MPLSEINNAFELMKPPGNRSAAWWTF